MATEIQTVPGNLETKRDELQRQVAALADKIREMDGRVSQAGQEATAQRRSELAASRIALSQKVNKLRAELKTIDVQLSEAGRSERRAEFSRLISVARKAQQSYIEHSRAACIALGTLANSVQRATTIANTLGCPVGGGPWPIDSATLRELSTLPNVYTDWAGFVPVIGFGFDWCGRIAPMKPEFSEQKQDGALDCQSVGQSEGSD